MEGGNESDDVATGPQDAEVSGCTEPLGAQRAFGARGWRDSRNVGTAVPTLPAALRGGWVERAGRSSAGQGLAAACADRQGEGDAWAIPDAPHGMEREALSPAHSEAARLPVGLHLDQDAAANSGAGRASGSARGASPQTAAQALRGHDAASGRQPLCLA